MPSAGVTVDKSQSHILYGLTSRLHSPKGLLFGNGRAPETPSSWVSKPSSSRENVAFSRFNERRKVLSDSLGPAMTVPPITDSLTTD